MRRETQKIVLSFIGFIFVCAAFAGGFYFSLLSSSQAVSDQNQTNTQAAKTKVYSNKQLQFSVEYPSELTYIQESDSGVSFQASKDDRGSFAVHVENTPFSSTKDWLQNQTHGSASSAGYELISWLALPASDAAIVSEYVVAERDGRGTPIYRKGQSVITVANGLIYKLPLGSGNQLSAQEEPIISSQMLEFVFSFRPYVDR